MRRLFNAFCRFVANFMSRRNPLFFRKGGALDFGPFLLLTTAGVGLTIFVLEALGLAKVSIAAWAFMGSFAGLAFIAGAAQERAYWISKSALPGEIAKGIAASTPLDRTPERLPDDERE